jgi:hypothetical protein
VIQHINLYHAEFRPPKNPLPARYIFAALGAMLLLMGLLHGLARWDLAAGEAQLASLAGRASQMEAQAAGLQSQVAERRENPALVAEIADFDARTRSLDQIERVITGGELGSTSGFAGHFRALSRVQASGAWLTGATLDGSPVAMSLNGRALAGDAPARYLSALRREPGFAGMTFAGLVIREPDRTEAGTGSDSLEFRLVNRLEEPTPATGTARP